MRQNRVSTIIARALPFSIEYALFYLALSGLSLTSALGAPRTPTATRNSALTPTDTQAIAPTGPATPTSDITSTGGATQVQTPAPAPKRTLTPTSPQICSTPLAISPTQGAGSGGKFSTDPTQIDVKVFDEETASLSVINQTPVPVERIRFSTLELFDGKTGQHISAADWDTVLEAPLGVNERTDCHLLLKLSNHAGAFTGTLRIDADSGYNATAPLTIRIRGPYFPVWRTLPFLFLTLVFGLGWGLSMTLDYWFTVKLPFLEQVVALKQLRTAFGTFLEEVATWETKHGVALMDTDIAAACDKSNLDTLLLNISGRTVADMQQAITRFTTSSALNDELYTAIKIAAAKIPEAGLASVAKELDKVSRNQTVAAYHAALLAALTATVPAAVPPDAVTTATSPSFRPGTDLSKATAASLHEEAVAMDLLKTAVLGVVVWLTAYLAYYIGNPSFGTSTDYVTLFLWSLGLTATGSQIVNSVKKP